MSSVATQADIEVFLKRLKFKVNTFRDQFHRPLYCQATSTVQNHFALGTGSYPCVYITSFPNESGQMMSVSPPIKVEFPPFYFIGYTSPSSNSVHVGVFPHYKLCRTNRHMTVDEHKHQRPTVMHIFESDNGTLFAKPTTVYETSEFFQILNSCKLLGEDGRITLFAE